MPNLDGLTATVEYYCGSEWKAPDTEEQKMFFVLAALHHLGGSLRDYKLCYAKADAERAYLEFQRASWVLAKTEERK